MNTMGVNSNKVHRIRLQADGYDLTSRKEYCKIKAVQKEDTLEGKYEEKENDKA